MAKFIKVSEKILTILAIALFFATIAWAFVAVFDGDNYDEAYIGDFKPYSFNENWTVEKDGNREPVTLPITLENVTGKEIIMRNAIPNYVSDGMTLMLRASVEDIYIYIDGSLRQSYASKYMRAVNYYLPSAYVACPINSNDAGKSIEIVVDIKANGLLNEINIAYGDDSWFPIIKDNLAVTMMAVFMCLIGLVPIIAYEAVFKKYDKTKSLNNLGLLIISIGIWIISESKLRQIIFKRPSLTNYFTYIAIGLVGIFAVRFINEVQARRYHKVYLLIEFGMIAQIIINFILFFTGVAELYATLRFQHIWMLIGIAYVIVTISRDVIDKTTQNYRITCFGLLIFAVFSAFELAVFYARRGTYAMGLYMCIGLIGLLLLTCLQSIHNASKLLKEHEKKREQMTISTIETISSAIDAKDEYTGGHSYRVGKYASALAKEVSDLYGFNEDDIVRIRYIGLLHDIGKIGVADDILNKTGRLTKEEFDLMKTHPIIGYRLLSALGDFEGLLDGIRFHHERYDGSGYPDGLKGDSIPLIARILGIADAYDAMTSNRVYRTRLDDSEVKAEIEKCSGSQFDPYLASVFGKLIDTGEVTPVTVGGLEVNKKGEISHS
ncbi:MAG: HD-GYP domain-containing protein, partial [Lachnospiraceae bacterium]|nr:HD-GYP domain-containing protein [Lachnospiraceae bacterium]